MIQLQCTDLCLGYEGKPVVEHLTFSVEEGSYWFVVGENGSGKSTLIKAILRLHPPMSGEIRFDPSMQKGDIGYLPQQTAEMDRFPATVREVVLSGCLGHTGLRPWYTRQEKETAEMWMEKFAVQDLAKKRFQDLSGGQKQRVLLARALCATRKMLLLDEPVTGLDPVAQADLYRRIADLNHEEGVTIFMISHDIDAALRYGSHILHMGQTPLFCGEKDAYFESAPGKAFLRERSEVWNSGKN